MGLPWSDSLVDASMWAYVTILMSRAMTQLRRCDQRMLLMLADRPCWTLLDDLGVRHIVLGDEYSQHGQESD